MWIRNTKTWETWTVSQTRKLRAVLQSASEINSYSITTMWSLPAIAIVDIWLSLINLPWCPFLFDLWFWEKKRLLRDLLRIQYKIFWAIILNWWYISKKVLLYLHSCWSLGLVLQWHLCFVRTIPYIVKFV